MAARGICTAVDTGSGAQAPRSAKLFPLDRVLTRGLPGRMLQGERVQPSAMTQQVVQLEGSIVILSRMAAVLSKD